MATVKEDLESKIALMEKQVAEWKQELAAVPEEVHGFTTDLWEKVKSYFEKSKSSA